MNLNEVYVSSLAPFIEGLILQKRADGYIYKYQAYIFKVFDKFLVEIGYTDTIITRELSLNWAIQRDTEGINYRNQRVSFLRQLALYMNSLGINSYIPHLTASTAITVPHLLSDIELKNFFQVVDSYVPRSEIWHRFSLEYQVIFRLYYCCGLRLAEAINIKRSQIDLDNGVLEIMQSKGNRDRLVCISEDMASLCRKYNEILIKIIPVSKWFFPGRNPEKPFEKTGLDRKFRQFWNMTPHASTCDKRPTIHSLRHTFVVNRINEWMRCGLDLNVMLPYLSRYLGHSSIEDTFYYYHQVDKAFQIIRQKDSMSNIVIPEAQKYEG